MIEEHPVREWRKTHGLTLAALASRVGIKQAHLSAIETYKKSMSLGVALRLANETGVPIEQLRKIL